MKSIKKVVKIVNTKEKNLGELCGGQIPPAAFNDPEKGRVVIQLNYPEKI